MQITNTNKESTKFSVFVKLMSLYVKIIYQQYNIIRSFKMNTTIF